MDFSIIAMPYPEFFLGLQNIFVYTVYLKLYLYKNN